MSEYIAIQSDPGDFLAHYGVKGMKWGVRKAISRGNSRALGRQYKKAAKKLAKLEKRANSGKKYAKRAAALGAGAALAGGTAAVGSYGIGGAMRNVGNAIARGSIGAGKLANAIPNSKIRSALVKASQGAGAAGVAMSKGGRGLQQWSQGTNLSGAARKGLVKAGNAVGGGKLVSQGVGKANKALYGVSNSGMVRLGAAGAAAGLGAGAAYNAYRAATTKRAARKAAQFRSEMNKVFAGTQYANGAPRKTKKRRK